MLLTHPSATRQHAAIEKHAALSLANISRHCQCVRNKSQTDHAMLRVTATCCKQSWTLSEKCATVARSWQHLRRSACRGKEADWLVELRFYVPLNTKIGHFGDVPQANLLTWYGETKPNTTKHTFTKNTKKLKPDLAASYDIRPGNGEGLFWIRRFINLSLTYLPRHLPTYLQSQDPRGAEKKRKNRVKFRVWDIRFQRKYHYFCRYPSLL